MVCRSEDKLFAVAAYWVSNRWELNWVEAAWHCTWRSGELQLVVGLQCFLAAFCKRDPLGIQFREQEIATRVLENWKGRCWRLSFACGAGCGKSTVAGGAATQPEIQTQAQRSSLSRMDFEVNLNVKVLTDTMTGSSRFSDRFLIKKEAGVVQKLSQTQLNRKGSENTETECAHA